MKKIRFILIIAILAGALYCMPDAKGAQDSSGAAAPAATSIPASTFTPVSTYRPYTTPAPTATPTPVITPEPASKELKIGGEVKQVYEKDGYFILKNNIKKYRLLTGKILKKRFFLNNDHIYYAKKDGEIARGWFKKKGNIYFFSRKKGRLTEKKKVEGVKLNKYGIAKKGEQNQERAETYIKAANIVRSISKTYESKADKLYKCYKWVMQFGYVRHRTMKEMMEQADWKKTWDIVFANDIFDKHSGCCVADAAAFALLAKECGYKNVTLCCDTGHSWDDIGGKLYDPLFAKARDFDKNYNAVYSDYRINPAITKKIS